MPRYRASRSPSDTPSPFHGARIPASRLGSAVRRSVTDSPDLSLREGSRVEDLACLSDLEGHSICCAVGRRDDQKSLARVGERRGDLLTDGYVLPVRDGPHRIDHECLPPAPELGGSNRRVCADLRMHIPAGGAEAVAQDGPDLVE